MVVAVFFFCHLRVEDWITHNAFKFLNELQIIQPATYFLN